MTDTEMFYYMHDEHMSTTHYHSGEEELTANDKWNAFGITVLAGFAAFIGALSVFCIKKEQVRYVVPVALSFSAGVIIHLSFLHLVAHAVENFQFVLGEDVSGHHHHHRLLLHSSDHETDGEIDALAHLYTLLCIIAGMTIMFIFGKLGKKYGFGHDHEHDFDYQQQNNRYGSTELAHCGTNNETGQTSDNRLDNKPDNDKKTDHNNGESISMKQISFNMAVALILHHFPEGIATYVALVYEFEFGILVALALSIHDIPCGISIGSTVYCATQSYVKPFIYCLIAALAYPLGALVGYIIIEQNEDSELLNGILFGIVSGIMIYIVLIEILPSSIQQIERLNDNKIRIYSYCALFVGLLVMEISVILLAATGFHSH